MFVVGLFAAACCLEATAAAVGVARCGYLLTQEGVVVFVVQANKVSLWSLDVDGESKAHDERWESGCHTQPARADLRFHVDVLRCASELAFLPQVECDHCAGGVNSLAVRAGGALFHAQSCLCSVFVSHCSVLVVCVLRWCRLARRVMRVY